MIAFLRNFCASLAALIVFFIAVPFTFLVIIAAVIASIGEGQIRGLKRRSPRIRFVGRGFRDFPSKQF